MPKERPTPRKACASCGHDLGDLCCPTPCPRCGAAQPDDPADQPPARMAREPGCRVQLLIAIALAILLAWVFLGPVPSFP